jgi:hypothetical protein
MSATARCSVTCSNNVTAARTLREPLELITHLPIERRDGELYAAGVRIRGFGVGPVASSRLYIEIDNALNARAVAAGSNMPVGLDPEVKFLRCRRCSAPFIAMPTVRLCSEECRTTNRREAVIRSRAKRVEHGWRERVESGQIVCVQCGRLKEGRSRSTKRFCSVRCRVAAHRGVRPQPMDAEALDYLIGQIEATLGVGLAVEFPDLVLQYSRRLTKLKAERARKAYEVGDGEENGDIEEDDDDS